MENTGAFAQGQTTPEAIIEHVVRQLAGLGAESDPQRVKAVAEQAVYSLWESPIKIFVPVLALREARETLQAERGPYAVSAGRR
ncbi:MAG: hypothetical protein U0031_19090 [Thermomicrobiales bacterium]